MASEIKKTIKIEADTKTFEKQIQKAFSSFDKNLPKTLKKTIDIVGKAFNNNKNPFAPMVDALKELNKEIKPFTKNLDKAYKTLRLLEKEKKETKTKNEKEASINRGMIAKQNRVVLKEQDKEYTTQRGNWERFRRGISLKQFTPSAIINRRYDTKITQTDEALGVNQEELLDLQNKLASTTNEDEKKNLQSQIAAKQKERQVLQASRLSVTKAQTIFNTVAKVAGTITKEFSDTLKSVTGINLSIKGMFKDILSSVSQMTDQFSGMATYATGSSLITNAQARATQMKYGLSDAENYAMTQTMSTLGMKSDEDLMYMNRNQQELFTQYMDKYSSWYEQLMSSGALQSIQELQLDFAMMKQEIAVEFLQWFAENKDVILSAVRVIANVLKGIFQVIAGIANIFGAGIDTSSVDGSAASSDSVNNSSSYNNGKTINITMSNNATGVISDQSQMEEFFNDKMRELAGQLATSM